MDAIAHDKLAIPPRISVSRPAIRSTNNARIFIPSHGPAEPPATLWRSTPFCLGDVKRFYALRPEPFQELSQFVTTYRTIWKGRLDRIAAELERRRKNKEKSR